MDNNPIAVLSNSIEMAIHFLRELIDIESVERHKRLVTAKDGKKYYIITDIRHTHGNYYSEIIRTSRAWENPNYEELNVRLMLQIR